MRRSTFSGRCEMRLYDQDSSRLYLNAEERRRFLLHAKNSPPDVASFCMTLAFTGCRISEALELRQSSIQQEAQIVTFRTLKRRRASTFREVPIPKELITTLNQQISRCAYLDAQGKTDRLIWACNGSPIHRVTAYRWIKAVMQSAGITGAKACPKGLQHGFGIHAIRSGVQLNMLQKWMGHASMATTSIYANATGTEELMVAARMWQ